MQPVTNCHIRSSVFSTKITGEKFTDGWMDGQTAMVRTTACHTLSMVPDLLYKTTGNFSAAALIR